MNSYRYKIIQIEIKMYKDTINLIVLTNLLILQFKKMAKANNLKQNNNDN